MTVAAGAASIAMLAVVNFLLGTVQTLRDNAALAIVPELVEREKLETANSRVQAAQLITMELIGPPLGAVLFSLPAGSPFFADSLSFVVSAVAVFGIAAVARKSAASAPFGERGVVGGGVGCAGRWCGWCCVRGVGWSSGSGS
ncbi:MFS transporter [Amycolatopsis sp. SID8362]|uniref:MFS transporter n=1 Tax=Amycolatopsis sp. SID8362 TaxID=2690346 RepID=UPI00136EAD98|nr:MFS transporter [Amycolatopsis sp. SID8362]NBH08276.1 hypothetical protein [Amycolatopsis sp. SID8362]NED44971.1 MFS transporter [Amycolatopsis sp. SID8362]